MIRDRFINALFFVCLLTNGIAFGQSNTESNSKNVCSFSLVGMWKSGAAADGNLVFIRFSPDGWVRWLGHAANTLPQDFELLSEVKYELDKPFSPKLITFTARRGDDVFPPGKSSMEIVEYGDDSFTTMNPESGLQTLWAREPTKRNFLTFAYRNADQSDGAAFVMWTTFDGRNTEMGALGVQMTKAKAGGMVSTFGPISPQLYKEFTNENEKGSDVMMRIELTEAEFERSRKLFETWEKRIKEKGLPYKIPYLNGIDFLTSAAESVNQCDEKLKLQKLDLSNPGNLGAESDLPQRLLEYIRTMRKQNKEQHITNQMFPSDWTPALLPNGL